MKLAVDPARNDKRTAVVEKHTSRQCFVGFAGVVVVQGGYRKVTSGGAQGGGSRGKEGGGRMKAGGRLLNDGSQ